MYSVPLKLNKDFEKTFEQLDKKYGEDFEFLNGFHESQLDFSNFIDGFVDKKTADATIDSNSNASAKDIRSLMSEKGKPHDKLFAFSKIFYELKKKYGLKTAREWFDAEYSGGFYLHDAFSSTYMPYCYAYDLTRLSTEGLFFLNNYNNKPPKHLTTFVHDLIEYISFMSNRSSGAVGIPNLLIWTYYFWKKDCESNYILRSPEYYAKQNFQEIIYRLNQPFMRIDQTAFVNVSIFDRNYIESLFGGMEYPDGTFVIDEIENIIEHQKIFMEVVSEIREENLFTFPVLTYSLLYKDGKFVDKDFARWCSDHNTMWNDSNFFMSDDVGVLSNCPVSGDTEVVYYLRDNYKYVISSIKELYHNLQEINQTVYMISNGKEIECKVNKFNMPVEYEIELVNGAIIKTTANHLNKVYGKDYVQTRNLTTDNYLPYGLHPLETFQYLTYEEGLFVGMFLGSGSYGEEDGIKLSLDKHKIKKKEFIAFLQEYRRHSLNRGKDLLTFSFSETQSHIDVSIHSPHLRRLVEMFVEGTDTLSKAISGRAFIESTPFKQGLIDGLCKISSGNLNEVHTNSVNLERTLIALCATLGIVTDVSTKDFSRNKYYIIQFYKPNEKNELKNVYIKDENYLWVKIKEIRKIPNDHLGSYCVEVVDETQEPVFTLANGIITHNCRLLSDTKKLNAFINSIGGTALSIGSVKVNTINLMRIGYETEFNEKKYLALLKKRVILCCKVLDVIRHIISRNIEKGLLPNYCDGGIEMSKQYCTIGILGLYEIVEAFGHIIKDEFGNTQYTDEGIEFASKIFEVLNEVKDSFTDEYSFNIESVPAERAAVILCKKDNLLYDINEKFIYSNQWIPLSEKCTIQEKLRLSSILDKKCSGGSIAHINLDSNFPNTDMAWDMLNKIAQSGVIYFAFNTKINECKNHHGFVGADICPVCGEPVYDTYQRVVGYLVPSRNYSEDRFKEFDTRQWYDYAEALRL